MRRRDREVTEKAQLEDIVRRCDCIHLGLMDGDYPYVVPMNFGYEWTERGPVFYMHAAGEGKKLELIRKSGHASFCMDTSHQLVQGTVPCSWSYLYESVMGRGEAVLVTDPEEKRRGMASVLSHYSGSEEMPDFPENMMERVAIIRLTASEITGKQHK